MTCEVAVANRLAIALAADSAVTLTTQNGQTTYASGANKIFQLANNEPVAVMIYNDASLQGIPWELIVKSYRSALAGGAFDTVQEYQADLVDFINSRSDGLLPAEVRARQTVEACRDSIVQIVNTALQSWSRLRDAAAPLADLQADWAAAVAAVEADLATRNVPGVLNAADLVVAQATHGPGLEGEVLAFLGQRTPHLVPAVNIPALVNLGIRFAFLRPEDALSYTGVVIAGFGQTQYMPGFVNIRVLGFVGTRLYWTHVSDAAVDFTDRPSLIEPFARKSMVETFTQGASPEVWKSVKNAFQAHATAVCTDAVAKSGLGVVDPAVISQAVNDRIDEFTKDWAYATFGEHLRPLYSVIASLNIEELAELAETLVSLESLKEKVTRRTQSVGGPIDVAVITKSEGLVWIKRKLYFDPQLNQRYFVRMQRNQ